jgi:NADPH:quinone reductase-like Zn-dependent oxidoreductase
MRAVRVHEFGPPTAIVVEELPRPVPGAGEVLIEVHAAGVGLWDAWIRAGGGPVDQMLPLTLGADVSGVIVEIGPHVTCLKPGDEVFGVVNSRFTNGYAEYAVAVAEMVARKPARASFVEAASMPVVAVTAWQMLFDHAQIKPGHRVLVLGADGNVGGYAVQLAHHHGANVIGVINSDEGARVKALGADPIIDLRHTPLMYLEKVDVVIDALGGINQHAALSVLKPDGLMVSAVSAPDEGLLATYKVRGYSFLVNTTTAYLNQIASRFDAGRLVANVGEVLPLDQARAAHEMLAGGRPRKRGRIVLAVR